MMARIDKSQGRRDQVKRHDWGTHRNAAHRMVVTTVRVAERLVKAADRFLKPHDLTVAQFNLLVVLSTVPDGLAQARIGEKLVVSRANVTGLVRRLMASGLCRIQEDPSDARVNRVVITPAGRKRLDRIQEGYFREIDRLTRTLTSAEMRSVSETMDRLGDVDS